MSTPSLGRKSNRFRVRSLEAAAVGLAASSVPDVASAAIIYDLALTESPSTTFSVDGSMAGEIDLISQIGGMLTLDLILEGPAMGGGTVQLSVFSGGGGMPTDYLSFLNSGDTVDASLTFANEAYLIDGGTVNPAWTPGATGYAGFIFDDGGGIPLYGWLEIQFDINELDFTVTGFAYDDTGAAMIAGSIVPEPSTALLLGLGLAALSIKFRKRLRTRIAPP